MLEEEERRAGICLWWRGNSHIISAVLKEGEGDDLITEEWVIEEEKALTGRRMQQLRQDECICTER